MSFRGFGALIKSFCLFSLHKRALHSSYRTASPKPSNFFFDGGDGGSDIYRHALRFQRPTTIQLRPHLCNSVSFIGFVDLPLQLVNTKRGLGVYTMLKVKKPGHSNGTLRILLKMWNEMAEMCLEYLKPEDFVYVSGRIASYEKADEEGKLTWRQEVIVKELNYVARAKGLQYEEEVGKSREERRENQVYLWQVFFSNPFEWWDNRRAKPNSRKPDFKHKDTGESLWLGPTNPPWVKRQLELLDSKIGDGLRNKSSRHLTLDKFIT